MDSTLKKEQSALKAFITSPEDDIREPYAKKSTRRARHTSFCASVNPFMFLKDDTGNRRFWIIHIEKIECKELKELGKEWIIQLWLQLYQEVKDNINCFRLTAEESEELRINNLTFTESLPFEEELMLLIDFNSNEKEIYINKDIVELLRDKFNISNATPQMVGRALNKIADNYPEAIDIRRGSKGIKYRLKIKDEYTKKNKCRI